MSTDTLIYVAFGVVAVLGTAALCAAPYAFAREYHRDDPIHTRLRVRLLLAFAAVVDNATWPARGGVR